MKRILGLSSIPVEGSPWVGAERIANLYRYLPARYARTLLTLTGLRAPRGEAALPGDVRLVRLPSVAQTVFHYLQALRLLPFFRVFHFHRRFPLGAAPLLGAPFDLVQFDSLWLTPWAARLPAGTPVVYGSHNFETEWYQGELRRFLFRKSHGRALERLEREAIARADRVIAVTNEDREKFLRLAGGAPDRIVVVPNGYDDERFRPASPEEKRAAREALGLPAEATIALFAGSNVAPNREAVESILRAIAPRTSPEVLFVVAGGVGKPFQEAASPNVRFTGKVAKIVPYFRAADVGLNPIRLGSGSNIKVLQYLGSGLPVVSTDFGMRGFDDLRPHVRIARIDRFHYHLSRALPDPAAAAAVRRYSWKRAAATLAKVYDALLGGTPPEGAPV